MAIDWGAELGVNSPQQSQGFVDNAVVANGSAQSGSERVEPRHDPVKMLQYARDAGTRNVESMGQIGADWFDGIPQAYDDDQIAAAKSAISQAQTPDEVYQVIHNLAGQNKGGNVGAINNALGQMGVGYSSDAGFSDIGRGIRSMTGTLDRVDVPADNTYEAALQWLGNAIPNAAAAGDLFVPMPSGAASAAHLYKGAKALPGTIASGAKATADAVKAAPGKAAGWYKGRFDAYSDKLAGKTAAGETAQTGGRAAETAETAAPATERTAASETAAPATERTAASETAAPAPRQEPAPAEGSPELRSNADGTPDLAGTINGEGSASGAAGGAPKTGAGEAAGTLSNYERQQYNNYINMVQNDSDLADLVSSTLNRVVGNGRSIDSLSDAELSEFYAALNDAVNSRWTASLFGGMK